MPAVKPLRKGAVLAIVLASYTMIVPDISIVITALPKIHRALDFSATALSWVQNAYLLAFGALLLLGARAGDLIGRRRIFIIGLGLFTIASAAVGTAQSKAWHRRARRSGRRRGHPRALHAGAAANQLRRRP
jgi:MFS family permease